MLKPLNILVVDDGPEVGNMVKSFLLDKGFSVELRFSGRTGLDALRDYDISLVIADIHTAEVNGFEFIQLARKNHPHLGIILMADYEDEHSLSEALQSGADGYISKPFSLNKFSLIFQQSYWKAVHRCDWWENNQEA